MCASKYRGWRIELWRSSVAAIIGIKRNESRKLWKATGSWLSAKAEAFEMAAR